MSSAWWNSKTPAQKKAYIKAHPNSKYAKNKNGNSIQSLSYKGRINEKSLNFLQNNPKSRFKGLSAIKIAERVATPIMKNGKIVLTTSPKSSANIRRAVKHMNKTFSEAQRKKIYDYFNY